jgi:hypothetical protein
VDNITKKYNAKGEQQNGTKNVGVYASIRNKYVEKEK